VELPPFITCFAPIPIVLCDVARVARVLGRDQTRGSKRLYPTPELGYQARQRRHAPAVFTAETRTGYMFERAWR
jgi:hypothetical protein